MSMTALQRERERENRFDESVYVIYFELLNWKQFTGEDRFTDKMRREFDRRRISIYFLFMCCLSLNNDEQLFYEFGN